MPYEKSSLSICILSSILPFFQQALKKYEIDSFIKFGFLINEEKQFPDLSQVPKENQLNFSAVLAYNEAATKFLVEARNKGINLCAYFGYDILETEQIYKRLIQLGCTSLITNQPHTIKSFRLKYFGY